MVEMTVYKQLDVVLSDSFGNETALRSGGIHRNTTFISGHRNVTVAIAAMCSLLPSHLFFMATTSKL